MNYKTLHDGIGKSYIWLDQIGNNYCSWPNLIYMHPSVRNKTEPKDGVPSYSPSYCKTLRGNVLVQCNCHREWVFSLNHNLIWRVRLQPNPMHLRCTMNITLQWVTNLLMDHNMIFSGFPKGHRKISNCLEPWSSSKKSNTPTATFYASSWAPKVCKHV